MPGFQDDIVSILIKHHLRVKPFYGRSENAVKSQLWIAVFGLCAVCGNSETVAVQAQSLHIDAGPEPVRGIR